MKPIRIALALVILFGFAGAALANPLDDQGDAFYRTLGYFDAAKAETNSLGVVKAVIGYYTDRPYQSPDQILHLSVAQYTFAPVVLVWTERANRCDFEWVLQDFIGREPKVIECKRLF
jgi:hypothetical protein